MTPEAINQAMAELDGWKLIGKHGFKWESENGTRHEGVHFYTKDLNAVARVVEKLDETQWWKYRDRMKGLYGSFSIDATALQRCEAVLRACGKWVEG